MSSVKGVHFVLASMCLKPKKLGVTASSFVLWINVIIHYGQIIQPQEYKARHCFPHFPTHYSNKLQSFLCIDASSWKQTSALTEGSMHILLGLKRLQDIFMWRLVEEGGYVIQPEKSDAYFALQRSWWGWFMWVPLEVTSSGADMRPLTPVGLVGFLDNKQLTLTLKEYVMFFKM